MDEPVRAPVFRLVEPAVELRDAYLAMLRDFEAHGEPYGNAWSMDIEGDFAGFVAALRRFADGHDLSTGFVPWTSYWLVRDEAIVGRASFRHHLTPALEIEGGHIGYAIRPSARRQGNGTQILRLLLHEARRRGYPRVMLTCDADNTPSRRIIVGCGGVLAGRARSPRTRKLVERYWIELT